MTNDPEQEQRRLRRNERAKRKSAQKRKAQRLEAHEKQTRQMHDVKVNDAAAAAAANLEAMQAMEDAAAAVRQRGLAGYGDRPVTQEEREWVAKYLEVPLEELEDKVVAAVIDSNL